MKKVLFGALLVTLVAATPARAQSGIYEDRSVHFNIGGGFTMPMSDISDRFGTGGGFNIGLIVEPNRYSGSSSNTRTTASTAMRQTCRSPSRRSRQFSPTGSFSRITTCST